MPASGPFLTFKYAMPITLLPLAVPRFGRGPLGLSWTIEEKLTAGREQKPVVGSR